MSFRLPSLRQIAVPVLAAFALIATATTATAADTTPPITVDDVPATYSTTAPVTATLTAKDELGGSGVAATRYTVGIAPEAPSVLSPIYDPADKPTLSNGERISYFSTDLAGNAEAVQTSSAVLITPATTHYTSQIASATGNRPYSVAAADVTGDGRPDLITANTNSDNVSVIARRTDNGGWETTAIAGTTGSRPYSVAVGDVTGDGRPDLITANYDSSDVSVIARKTDDSGWEATAIAGTTGSTPNSVAIGDVTGDGRPDLITANADSHNVSVIARRTDNSGWETTAIAGTTGNGPVSVAVGDVTGDGRPDLITVNTSSGDVSVIARKTDDAGWETSITAGSTGTNPYSVAVGDVTGDGRPDLITANYSSNDVSVIARKTDNSGWETAMVAGTTGTNPFSVAVADVTGDGHFDLITANTSDSDVSVIARKTDNSGWETTTIAGTTGSGPRSVAVADVTGDGRPDLITANANSSNASVLTARYDETPPVTTDDVDAAWHTAPVQVTLSAADEADGSGVEDTYYTVGATPETPTTASATYDPADKPTLTNGQKIAYFSVDRAGNAETVKTSSAAKVDPTAPTTTDDVDTGWHDAPVAVTLTATDGGSGVEDTYFTVGSSPETPTTSSATYDPADKPTLNDGEKIAYFSVDQAGNTEAVKTSTAARIDQTAPTTTDDVPATYRTSAPVRVTLTAKDTPGGSGVAATRYTTGVAPQAPDVLSPIYDPADKPVLADGERISYFSVDQAGNAETTKTSRAVVFAPATTHYTSQIAGAVGGQPMAVVAADVTGDGRPDLITANQLSHNVSVIARTSDGNGWEAATIAGSTGPSPRSVATADVTGDGRPDLVTANANGSNVSVIARNADGSGWEPTTIAGTTGFAPRSVTVADVTGDGRPDLITANMGDDNVSVIARNATDTGWKTSVTIPTRDAPSTLAVADVTGDGQRDLVTTHFFDDVVSVIARSDDGDGWEAEATAGTTGDSPDAVAVADVTGDGHPDLITANSGSGDLSVIARTSDGNGWQSAATVAGPIGSTPQSVAVEDMTGDGRPDLLIADTGHDAVSVIARNDNGTGWEPPVIAGTTGSTPHAVTVADVTDDGRPDLITANQSSDNVSVLTALHDGTPPVTSDDVDGDWHAAPITVTLTAEDETDGTGVAGTYYTVGATPETPTTASATYDPADKPTLDDGERIAYFSVDHAGNPEAVKTSGAAKIDQSAPSTVDDVDDDWHGAPVPVTLTATDPESGVADTYYTVGATPEIPTTDSETYDPADKPTLGDGERISYFSVDALGHAEAVKTSGAAKVDPTVPETTITASPAELGSDPRPSVAFSSVAPDGTFECAIDAGPFVPCASPFRPSSALPDGPHELRIRAVSRAGVVDPTPSRVAFVVRTSVEAPPSTNPPSTDPPPSTPAPTTTVPPSTEPSAARISLTAASAPGRAPTVLLGSRTALTCAPDVGLLRTCSVEARSVEALKTTKGKRLPAGTVLAQGTSTGGTSSLLAVDVRLTAAARSVAARYPLGIEARITTIATTTAGATLDASSAVRVIGNGTVVIPVRSASASTLSAARKRALAQLARTVVIAKSVHCAAYTDRSRSAAAARKLTTGQARAACRYLTRQGLKATTTIKGHGSARPRASNATAKGRAKNRRLEITITL